MRDPRRGFQRLRPVIHNEVFAKNHQRAVPAQKLVVPSFAEDTPDDGESVKQLIRILLPLFHFLGQLIAHMPRNTACSFALCSRRHLPYWPGGNVRRCHVGRNNLPGLELQERDSVWTNLWNTLVGAHYLALDHIHAGDHRRVRTRRELDACGGNERIFDVRAVGPRRVLLLHDLPRQLHR